MAAAPDGGLTRRAVLNGMLGATALSAASSMPATARVDGPPPFGTVRYQFTQLRPTPSVPPLQLTRLDGSVVNFASFRGKVVLVNFWATWCPACRTELPILDRLQEMAGRKDLQVVAISLDRGGRAAVAPFVRDLRLRHLDVYLDPESRIVSDDDKPATPFRRYGMPISYVVDRAGETKGYLAGEADWTSDAARDLLGYYAGRSGG
jgi:thiol-disulfide isomerase/thioredoxin